jgi:uncharacterized cysteine cluster protein YcgN (CxxCxxCC family)
VTMLSRVRRILSARRVRWEGLCKRCGLCCYEKDARGNGVTTDYRRPCIHLNTITKECTVYERRFARCPQCKPMTIPHALFVRWLPDSCGYVQHYRYRGRARGNPRAEPVPSEAREG